MSVKVWLLTPRPVRGGSLPGTAVGQHMGCLPRVQFVWQQDSLHTLHCRVSLRLWLRPDITAAALASLL